MTGRAQRVQRPPKRRVNPLLVRGIDTVDWKDTSLLRTFISDRGKIRARRVTGLTPRQQREVATAIRKSCGMRRAGWPRSMSMSPSRIKVSCGVSDVSISEIAGILIRFIYAVLFFSCRFNKCRLIRNDLWLMGCVQPIANDRQRLALPAITLAPQGIGCVKVIWVK